MKSSNKKDKKEDILDTCFKLFMAKNQGKINLSDLESAMGITRGAIYHHFKDMDEVLQTAVEYNFEKVVKYFNFFYQRDRTTLLNFIFDYVENWKNFNQSIADITNDGASSVMSFFMQASNLYPGFDLKIKSLLDQEQKCWEEILISAIEKKEIKEEVDVPVTAIKFHCIYMGVAIQSYFVPFSFKASTLQMLFLSLYNDIKKRNNIPINKFE